MLRLFVKGGKHRTGLSLDSASVYRKALQAPIFHKKNMFLFNVMEDVCWVWMDLQDLIGSWGDREKISSFFLIQRQTMDWSSQIAEVAVVTDKISCSTKLSIALRILILSRAE
jgi:hypothetical protein